MVFSLSTAKALPDSLERRRIKYKTKECWSGINPDWHSVRKGAAAVMENPELIVLDEPYNALDEETAAKIRQLILERKRRGSLIILSCHDREEIENTCDEIIEIKCGKITGIKEINREEGEKQNDE